MGHAAYPLHGTIPAEPIVHRLWERGETARDLAIRFCVPQSSMDRYLRTRLHKWEDSQRRALTPDNRKIVHTVRSFERSAYHIMHVSLPRISMHVHVIEDGGKGSDWRVAA
jgi:hypothetical protein